MEKQISIIIPTYNMEAYIGKCLASLLIPEFDQVEVLVVNDGSKDRSSEIAHSYADRYPNSIRVIDKPNGNYGSCINAALPLCTGRYVKVLDADDTFDTAAFSKFVSELQNRHEDVLITDVVRVNEFGQVLSREIYNLKPSHIYDFDEIYKLGVIRGIPMHAVCYKRDYLLKLNYRQTEGISFTDTEWIGIPIAKANTFGYSCIGQLYRYLIGRDGQTVDPAIFSKQIHSYITLLNNKALVYETLNLSLNRSEYFRIRTHALFYEVYLKSINAHEESISLQIKNLDQQIKSKSVNLYNNIAKICYFPHVRYFIIDQYRKSGYSSDFKIPKRLIFYKSVVSFIHKLKKCI